MANRKISRALISVFYKENLQPILETLAKENVEFISTGGTQAFIEELGYTVTPVESLTGFPSIFGGRVKTLHPAIFGGILFRREDTRHTDEANNFNIGPIDLVVVDLYPFEETVAGGGSEEEIIEKIDIGGISLIRAAAKNYRDVLTVSSRAQYDDLLALLQSKQCSSDLQDRRNFAARAFDTSAHYDSAIFDHFNETERLPVFRKEYRPGKQLRYGENPHQQGAFYGNLDELFEQLNGKDLSYNNLVDIDAATGLLAEFGKETAFVIIKHTNACGAATAATVREAYQKAFQADTISAFGGVLATSARVDLDAAREMNSLFFEILIAPAYDPEALELLSSRKNRILLRQKKATTTQKQFKSLLNGVIEQDNDLKTDRAEDLKTVTRRTPSPEEIRAMLFAAVVCKHTKSNTIVLAVAGQLLASGTGQTSRVDALKQAIEKAKTFGFDLTGAVMASDAFFPFPDCVDLAWQAGIRAVIQPGGSVRDQESIDFCDEHDMAMVFTGIRHFKH